MGYSVIFQVERIYYPVLAAVGIVVNVVAILILSRGKCGLSKCSTHYLVAMAAADLIIVFIDVILKRINNMYLPISILFLTPLCSATFVINVAALDCSVWFTVAFTFDRYIAICCQKLKIKYCTERTAKVIIAAIVVVAFLRSIPFYTVYEPSLIIDRFPWYCVVKAEYQTSTFWRTYELLDSILTPLLPICLILLFNALTIRHIIAANRVRRSLRITNENQNDPEMDNRRKSMILLFAISANFILLWMTYVVHSVTWQVQNYNYGDRTLNNPVYIAQQFGFMLQLLSCSTNTCIYGLTQRKFRDELRKGIKYLFKLT